MTPLLHLQTPFYFYTVSTSEIPQHLDTLTVSSPEFPGLGEEAGPLNQNLHPNDRGNGKIISKHETIFPCWLRVRTRVIFNPMMRGRGRWEREGGRLGDSNPYGTEEAFQFPHLSSRCLGINRTPQRNNVFSLLHVAEIRDHH